MNLQILGMGSAVPPHSITQRDAATIVIEQSINGRTDRQHHFVEEVYLHAGVEQRHSVILKANEGALEKRQTFFQAPAHPQALGPTTAERMRVYAEAAPALGIGAARKALQEANMQACKVTHVVTASCTGFYAPGIDLEFIERLQLPLGTTRTHVGFMGCHAAINALRVAQAYATDPAARVLLTCIELCSLHHQYGWSPEQVVANALFADGAATVPLRVPRVCRCRALNHS